MRSLKCLVLAFALAVVLVAAASPARAKVGQPSAVAPWIEFELNAIASHATNPPRAARALAHVSRAMYLAAVDEGRGRDDAVAGAASTVLVHLYPDEAASIAVLAGQLGDVNSPSFARGVAIGGQLVARADADGSGAVWTGSVPDGAGFWVPTPPAFIKSPLEPLAGTWRTWNLRDGSEFRPGPPPAFGSPGFNAEVRRGVRRLAGADRRAEADCGLLGGRSRNRHTTRPLEPHRARSRARPGLVDRPRELAVLSPEHRASRCLHRLLGRKVHLLDACVR